MAYEYVRVKRFRTRRRRRYRYLLCLLPVALAALWRFWPDILLSLRQRQVLALQSQAVQQMSDGEARSEQQYTLPCCSWYVLQLGAFGDAAAAGSVAEAYRGRGAAGCIWQEGEHHLVMAAAYGTREDALQVQDNLRTYHQVDTLIKAVSIPEVELRLEGTGAQVQGMCDALDCLNNLQHSLYHHALALDRGETDTQTVRDALASHLVTLEALKKGLTDAFAQEMPDAAVRLIYAFEGVMTCMKETQTQQGSARFGAGVKQAQLLCIRELVDWSGALAP